MNSEWRELPLGECLLKVVDNRGKTPPLAESKTPYGLIEVNALVGPDKAPNYSAVRKFVSAETYNSWFRSGHPVSGDLLFSTVGSVAEVALFNGGSGCIAQNIVGLRPNTEIISPNYLYYALVNPVMQLKLKTLDISSVQPSIKVPHLLAAKIQVPPFHLQERIGDILESLDDRITLLRETNATLEAIAQALFKSWFVDFDPVRAKAEGRQPEAMDATTAALFPDSFEESELGFVPKGWKAGVLSDLASFQNGYAFKSEDWVDTGHPVVKIGDVKPGLINFSGCSRIAPTTVVGLERFKLSRGDLLVGMTGYVGETGLVPQIEPDAYINQRVGRLVTRAGLSDIGMVYCAVRDSAYKFYAESQSHGSAQANVSGSALLAYPVVIPPPEVLCSFNRIVEPLLESILSNYEQAQTLTQLRDTLLPRLISGQLRLPEAEATVEEVL